MKFFRKSLKKLGHVIEGGQAIIEIRLRDGGQLFDQKDPSPLRVKDLHWEVEEYILVSAEEIGSDRIGKIIFYFDDPDHSITTDVVSDALRHFLEYQLEISRKKLSNILVSGFKSLVIGLSFLFLAVLVVYSLDNVSNLGTRFLKEGLTLLSWVSLWKPVNIFLYEWWPIGERISLLKQLMWIPVEMRRFEKYRHVAS